MEKQPQLHTIAPVYDENSKILILGSFPSVKSREAAFFYGHPQNRFWRVLAAVLGEETPQTAAEKKSLLLRHGVANARSSVQALTERWRAALAPWL